MGCVPIPKLDADNPQEVANGINCDVTSGKCSPFLEVVISGPGNANRLFIFSGTAIVTFEKPDETGTLSCEFDVILEKNLAGPKDFIAAATFASLAAIQSDVLDDYACGVLQVDTIVKNDGALRVVANLEVLDDTLLLRFNYQAHVLAHVD